MMVVHPGVLEEQDLRLQAGWSSDQGGYAAWVVPDNLNLQWIG